MSYPIWCVQSASKRLLAWIIPEPLSEDLLEAEHNSLVARLGGADVICVLVLLHIPLLLNLVRAHPGEREPQQSKLVWR